MAAKPRRVNIGGRTRRSTMTVDLTIRAAQITDAAALAGLMCELGYDTTEAEMQRRLERILPDERYRTFVAVRYLRVRGMIGTLASYSFEHNDLGGRILSLVVRGGSGPSGLARQ